MQSYRQVECQAGFIFKLCIEESDIVGKARVVQTKSSLGVILVWVGNCDHKDKGKQHEHHWEKELGDQCSIEPQGIVETLQKHGTELLYPECETSVGSCMCWLDRSGEGGTKYRNIISNGWIGGMYVATKSTSCSTGDK